jgi:hypothetical protein
MEREATAKEVRCSSKAFSACEVWKALRAQMTTVRSAAKANDTGRKNLRANPLLFTVDYPLQKRTQLNSPPSAYIKAKLNCGLLIGIEKCFFEKGLERPCRG